MRLNFGRGLPAETRFHFKYVVRLDTRCWEWTASRFSGKDYGQFYDGKRNRRAHVWSYEYFVKPVPEGLVLDHFLFPERCIGPACVNPEHLRPATIRENTLRGATFTAENLAKEFCKNGHPFDAANTYWRPDNARACKKCVKAAGERYRVRLK